MADVDIRDLLEYATALMVRSHSGINYTDSRSEAGLIVTMAIHRLDAKRGSIKTLIYQIAKSRLFSIRRSRARDRVETRDPVQLDYIAERPGAHARSQS